MFLPETANIANLNLTETPLNQGGVDESFTAPGQGLTGRITGYDF